MTRRRETDGKPTKSFSVRLPVRDAEALETIATAYGHSLNDEVRVAVAAHIARRLEVPETRERIRELKEQTDLRLDSLLAESGDGDISL